MSTFPQLSTCNRNKNSQLAELVVLVHPSLPLRTSASGFRTVGLHEHARADAWMLDQAHVLKTLCDDATCTESGRQLEYEVWLQQESGSHRFHILSKVLQDLRPLLGTPLILEVPLLSKHITKFVQFLLQCGANGAYDDVPPIMASNALS
ncbi:hypothetical protein DFH11DRAFT_1880628 [Phellopilus nigrolimitatus]|nr:hypothetical protein DFH11DRAFT_1880628 [Phellopilus nigrolimitatus]